MTDPRIAALAEAMDAANVQTLGWTPESAAAAIFAALPDGWCGHTTWRQTDTFNVWTGACGHLWLATTGPGCPTCAEIARLRRIEETARVVIESQTTITAGGQMVAMAPDPSALFALRAALEEKP